MVICIAFTTLQVCSGLRWQGIRQRPPLFWDACRPPAGASSVCSPPLPAPQTSYLLLFTVAFSCDKRSRGHANFYFPDRGGCWAGVRVLSTGDSSGGGSGGGGSSSPPRTCPLVRRLLCDAARRLPGPVHRLRAAVPGAVRAVCADRDGRHGAALSQPAVPGQCVGGRGGVGWGLGFGAQAAHACSWVLASSARTPPSAHPSSRTPPRTCEPRRRQPLCHETLHQVHPAPGARGAANRAALGGGSWAEVGPRVLWLQRPARLARHHPTALLPSAPPAPKQGWINFLLVSWFVYITVRRAPYHRSWLNVTEAFLYGWVWWAAGLALVGIYYPAVSTRPSVQGGLGQRCKRETGTIQCPPGFPELPWSEPAASPAWPRPCRPAALARPDDRLPGGHGPRGRRLWAAGTLAPGPQVARCHAV